jgi:hypothetical protein
MAIAVDDQRRSGHARSADGHGGHRVAAERPRHQQRVRLGAGGQRGREGQRLVVDRPVDVGEGRGGAGLDELQPALVGPHRDLQALGVGHGPVDPRADFAVQVIIDMELGHDRGVAAGLALVDQLARHGQRLRHGHAFGVGPGDELLVGERRHLLVDRKHLAGLGDEAHRLAAAVDVAMRLRLLGRVVQGRAPGVERRVQPDPEGGHHICGIGPAGPFEAVVPGGRTVGERRVVRLPPVGGHRVAAGHVVLEVVGVEVGVQPHFVAAVSPTGDGVRRDAAVARQIDAEPGPVALRRIDQGRVGRQRARVAVAGRQEDRAARAWKVPEPRQRQAVGEQGVDDAGEQPHVDVGVGNVDALQIDALVEDVVGAINGLPVSIEIHVERIALANVGDAARQIERPRRGAAGTDHGRVSSGRPAADRGDRCGAAGQGVMRGGAAERQRHRLQAGPGPRLVDGRRQEPGRRPVARRPDLAGDPERAEQIGVRPHRDQPPAVVDVGADHRRLGRRQRRLGEHDESIVGQGRAGHCRQCRRVERVQPFGAEDFGEIGAERRRRGVVQDHQDRRRGALPTDRGRRQATGKDCGQHARNHNVLGTTHAPSGLTAAVGTSSADRPRASAHTSSKARTRNSNSDAPTCVRRWFINSLSVNG